MNQEYEILQYLKQGNSLTPLEALNRFGCFRLGARCWDLKQKGYNIKSEIFSGKNGKHFARYKLIKDGELF